MFNETTSAMTREITKPSGVDRSSNRRVGRAWRRAVEPRAPRIRRAGRWLSFACIGLLAGCEVTFRIGSSQGDNGPGYSHPDAAPLSDANLPSGLPPSPHPPLTSASSLDLLFVVDNSALMAPWQDRMVARLSSFTDVITNVPGGQPDLHIAVISSSLGVGVYSNVPGCTPGTAGNQGGAFQHDIGNCAAMGWHAGEKFLSSSKNPLGGPPINNFDGDLAPVLSCIARIGDQGCGFRHSFASTQAALQKASDPNDPDNAGFLRPSADLAIVMLTNADDCSVPPDSTLFHPGVYTLADPSGLGGLNHYRCSEFGILCDPGLTPPPHSVNAPVTLTGCTSSEGFSPPGDPLHQLIRVRDFIEFVLSLKPGHAEKIFVAALAGPVEPYTVAPRLFPLPDGSSEVQPWLAPSCTSPSTTMSDDLTAEPAVRVHQWTDSFGPNGVFVPICADDFGPTLTAVAHALAGTSP